MSHQGCNVTTCPNGTCALTGECQLMPRVYSPPLAPDAPPASQRTIIAFTGLAGAGKSTAAQHLVASGRFQRVRFAGPLKAMMRALGCTEAEVDGHLKEVPCALLGGKTPRYAMQTIGTEWGRDLIDSDLWIRAWQTAVAAVPAHLGVVVDDCRFPNEAAAVAAVGGVLVRIERPGAGTSSTHVSEQHALPGAFIICNDGSPAALRAEVERFARDFSWRATDAAL